jgi:hypothetical protein
MVEDAGQHKYRSGIWMIRFAAENRQQARMYAQSCTQTAKSCPTTARTRAPSASRPGHGWGSTPLMMTGGSRNGSSGAQPGCWTSSCPPTRNGCYGRKTIAERESRPFRPLGALAAAEAHIHARQWRCVNIRPAACLLGHGPDRPRCGRP